MGEWVKQFIETVPQNSEWLHVHQFHSNLNRYFVLIGIVEWNVIKIQREIVGRDKMREVLGEYKIGKMREILGEDC